MEAFKGKFLLVSAEQYDQFLKAIGVGYLIAEEGDSLLHARNHDHRGGGRTLESQDFYDLQDL